MLLRSALIAVSLVSAVLCQRAAAGVILFQENFETRTTGATLTSFSPTVGDSFAGSAGTVSDDSTTVGGPADGAGGSAKFAQAGDPDLFRITPAAQLLTAGDTVTLSFDFWMENDGNKYVDIFAAGASITFNVPIYANGAIQWFHAGFHNVPGTFARGQWINYRIAANSVTGTFDAVIGGIAFSGTLPAGVPIDRIHLDLADSSNYLFYDNVVIFVPEPASVTLLAAGVALLGWRRARLQ